MPHITHLNKVRDEFNIGIGKELELR